MDSPPRVRTTTVLAFLLTEIETGHGWEDALLDAGVSRAGLDGFAAAYQHRDRRDYPAEDSAQVLAGMLIGQGAENFTMVEDAVAAAIVHLQRGDLTWHARDRYPAWRAVTGQGWAFEAAGISLGEATARPAWDYQHLCVLAALRGVTLPFRPAGFAVTVGPAVEPVPTPHAAQP